LSLPEPEPGLVICYAYLWADEHEAGREEGIKDRPCAIVLARQIIEGVTVVTVAPITHTPPDDPALALEIPPQTKLRLGLDESPSWIIATEVNDFVWPGPDLRPIPGTKPPRYDYGVLPPALFRNLRDRFLKIRIVSRSK
jgi:hypothetical protein